MQLTPTIDCGPDFDIAAASSAGVDGASRLENQDNFLLIDATGRALFLQDQQLHELQLGAWPAGHLRVAVLDGMGGHGHGREASEAVVACLLAMPACRDLASLAGRLDAIHAGLQARFAAADQDDPDVQDSGDAGAASEASSARRRAAARRPGTTLTLLEIAPGLAPLLYHVGDSRLYEVRDGAIVALTVDHVPATAFAMKGVLDAGQWWQQVHGEHRSQIAQAFLLGNTFTDAALLDDGLFVLDADCLPPFLRHLPDRRALALRADAIYILASDGFWACEAPLPWVASWPALLAADADADARALVTALFGAMQALPLDSLHIDNLTAIVIRPLGWREQAEDTYA